MVNNIDGAAFHLLTPTSRRTVRWGRHVWSWRKISGHDFLVKGGPKADMRDITRAIIISHRVSTKDLNRYGWNTQYRKVASRSTPRLVARPRIFRPFMKGKFDPYVLWPLAFDHWPLNSRRVYCSRLYGIWDILLWVSYKKSKIFWRNVRMTPKI